MSDTEGHTSQPPIQVGLYTGNSESGYVVKFDRQGGPEGVERTGSTLPDALRNMADELEQRGLEKPGYVP